MALHDRLGALGIPHVWDDYGPGGHIWPYWRRDLRQTLPWLMRAFAHPRRPPSPFSYRTIGPATRSTAGGCGSGGPALEWSELSGAGRRGFALDGQRPRARDDRAALPPRRAGARHGPAGKRRRAAPARGGRRGRARDAPATAWTGAMPRSSTRRVPPRAATARACGWLQAPRSAPPFLPCGCRATKSQGGRTAKSAARPARVGSRKRTRPARTVERTRRPSTQAVTRPRPGRATSIVERAAGRRPHVSAHRAGTDLDPHARQAQREAPQREPRGEAVAAAPWA